MNRRKFLIGLLGTGAVIAAGPIPKVIESLRDEDFISAVKAAMPSDEIYSNGKDYGFATLKYLPNPPYFEITAPEGFKPMREESNRLGAEAIARMKDKA